MSVETGDRYERSGCCHLVTCHRIPLINARTHPGDRAKEKYNKTSLGKVKVINAHINPSTELGDMLCGWVSSSPYLFDKQWRKPVEVLSRVAPSALPVARCHSLSRPCVSNACLFLSARVSLARVLSGAFGHLFLPAIGGHFLINSHLPPHQCPSLHTPTPCSLLCLFEC